MFVLVLQTNLETITITWIIYNTLYQYETFWMHTNVVLLRMHTLVRATLLNKWNAYYLLKDMIWKAATKYGKQYHLKWINANNIKMNLPTTLRMYLNDVYGSDVTWHS